MNFQAKGRLCRVPVWVEVNVFTQTYVSSEAEVIAEVEFMVDHDTKRNYQRVSMGDINAEFDSFEAAKRFVEVTHALAEV